MALPGSKSITNRALILAALADGDSTITGTLRSRDTDLMIEALRLLGIGIEESGDDGSQLTVRPGPIQGGTVDCGLAGTVMRFLPPLSVLAEGNVSFDGDAQARVRPLGVILDAMRLLGAQVAGNALPFTVYGTGALEGGVVDIDASGSSQFVSGLLLSGARYRHGLTVRHRGKPVPSMPHVEMTVQMLTEAGVSVTSEHDGAGTDTWTVAPGPIQAVDWVIEPDLSNATPFLAAAAVTGGRVSVPNWPARTTQGGDAIREILERMGCEVTWADHLLTVQGPRQLTGIDIDLRRVLHGGQSLTVHKPLPVSGTATLQTRVADVWDKGKAAVVVLEHSVTDEAGATRTLRPGDAALFRAGTWSVWRVPHYVRKHAICRDSLPAVVTVPLRAGRRASRAAARFAALLPQPIAVRIAMPVAAAGALAAVGVFAM